MDVKLELEGALRLKREFVLIFAMALLKTFCVGKVGKYSLFCVLNQPF